MRGDQTGIFYVGTEAGTATLERFPRQFTRSPFKGFDKRFLIILGSCALVFFSVVGILSQREVKQEVTEKEIQKIQERYARLVLNQPKPEVEEVEEETGRGQVAEQAQQEAETEEAEVDREEETFVQKEQRRQATREQRQQRREAVAEQVRSTGIFAAITAAGGSGGSSSGISDLLGATDGVGDLSDINVDKGTFATSTTIDPAELSKPRGKRRSGVDIKREQLSKASGAQIAASGQVNLTTKAPEMKDESGGAAVSTSRRCIQQVVQRESSRLKRVFENWLKRDPNLGGLLEVRFVILPTGDVSNVAVHKSTTGNDSFDQNIVRYVKRWQFSDCGVAGSIEIVYPFMFEGSK